MSARSASLPQAGDVIAGKYVLDRLLGQGGMGAVFAARHIKLSKAVAIKIMLADASNPEAAARFVNEGRAAANIQNDHVVRVDDVDEEMGYAYMVLELLEGEDLSQVLERQKPRRLPAHVVADYVLQALRGVSQAHAIGIVHRDLKPSNLFLARRADGTVVVKVLDFGISKAQGSSALAASPSALTSTKAMLGSPLYMSPEQLRSSKSVDQRADIWAMGVILYELMTGHHPFMGENLGELFAAILETDPAPLRSHVPDVPAGVEGVVLRCLQRRPDQRFQAASELAAALAPFASTHTFESTAMLGPGQAGSVSAHLAAARLAAPPTPGPITPATAVIGTVTPQGLARTASGGWHHTGSGSAAIPMSKTPLLVGAIVGGLVLVLAVVGIAVYAKKGKSDPNGVASITATASPPPSASATVVPLPATTTTTSASAQGVTTADVAPSAMAVASSAVTSPITPRGASPTDSRTKPLPPKVEPPPPPPPPKATARPSDGLQNAR